MEFRHLGRSGLKISEITYGNWLTHGSQVENDVATAVRARRPRRRDHHASTPPTSTPTPAAETVLGEALKGERRESLEIFTKVYWPTGPGGHNDVGLSRKHIMESINGSLHPAADRLRRPLPGAPLRQRDPARGDDAGLRRRRPRRARRCTSGSASGPPTRSAPATRWPQELGIQLISSQPQYSMLWRVIEAEVVPTCRELGISQIVWSPIAQGVLTGKYQPGQAPPAGSRATDEKGGADMIKRFMNDDVLTRVQALRPIADELGLTMAQLAVAWVLQNDNVAAAIVGASRPEQVAGERPGRRGADPGRADGADRRGAGRHRRARPGPDRGQRPGVTSGLTPADREVSCRCAAGP